ncbi:MAG: hypothetical protein WD827_05365 [Solirubrobacterales bacterium]
MSGTVDIKPTLFAALAIATLAVVFVLPVQALAASDCASAGSDPTAAQYCSEPPPEEPPPEEPPPEREVEVINESSPPPEKEVIYENSGGVAGVSDESSGSLPFTGVDLLALAAVACAFICIGLALQRMSSTKSGSR